MVTEPVAEREPYAEAGMPAGLREEVGVEEPPGAGELVREVGLYSSSSSRFVEVLGPAAEEEAAPAPLRL